jgi:hypothetical protein
MNKAGKIHLDIQEKLGGIAKNRKNEHLRYRYADIGQILEVINPILHEHGAYVVFYLAKNTDNWEVNCTLYDKDNGKLDSTTVPLLGIAAGEYKTPNSPMQNLGSAITYARRYALINLFNLHTCDDDGEQGMDRSEKARSAGTNAPTAGATRKIKWESVDADGFTNMES